MSLVKGMAPAPLGLASGNNPTEAEKIEVQARIAAVRMSKQGSPRWARPRWHVPGLDVGHAVRRAGRHESSAS